MPLRMSLPPRTFLRSCMVKMKFSAIGGGTVRDVPQRASAIGRGRAMWDSKQRVSHPSRRLAHRPFGVGHGLETDLDGLSVRDGE